MAENEISWHRMSEDEVQIETGASPETGLTDAQVADHRRRFGPNALTQKKGPSPLLVFLLQFHQPLIYILIISGIVTAFFREYVDSSVILGVVLPALAMADNRP